MRSERDVLTAAEQEQVEKATAAAELAIRKLNLLRDRLLGHENVGHYVLYMP